ncbi:MAG: TRAM domain-containing protein [Eubacteriaceae bacterium]|nr:TRAM domain-containing protein [Eubacteriaceae bacterium]
MKSLFYYLLFALGFLIGYNMGESLFGLEAVSAFMLKYFPETAAHVLMCSTCGILLGIIFIIIIPRIIKVFSESLEQWIASLKGVSMIQLIIAVVFIIIALLISSLICVPIYKIDMPDVIKALLAVIVYVGLTYGAVLLAFNRGAEIETAIKGIVVRAENSERSRSQKRKSSVIPKILDTSVIIDGKIYDILKTGFIDGPIVISTLVVEELQYIADSSDALKRNRGRRGLDILNLIQKELPLEVIVSDNNYDDIPDVDNKIIRLTKNMKGKVITNDYNLNKVAEIMGVEVLNINELANAVKTVVLPGEELRIHVLREGKEDRQGVAYLDDGTMIVVEDGKGLIGKDITATVTSVLQTSAGKMVFVRPSSVTAAGE